jgi:hypothetical protein
MVVMKIINVLFWKTYNIHKHILDANEVFFFLILNQVVHVVSTMI